MLNESRTFDEGHAPVFLNEVAVDAVIIALLAPPKAVCGFGFKTRVYSSTEGHRL